MEKDTCLQNMESIDDAEDTYQENESFNLHFVTNAINIHTHWNE